MRRENPDFEPGASFARDSVIVESQNVYSLRTLFRRELLRVGSAGLTALLAACIRVDKAIDKIITPTMPVPTGTAPVTPSPSEASGVENSTATAEAELQIEEEFLTTADLEKGSLGIFTFERNEKEGYLEVIDSNGNKIDGLQLFKDKQICKLVGYERNENKYEDMTIDFIATSVRRDTWIAGLLEYENGIWSEPKTNPAPKNKKEVESWNSLILRGEPGNEIFDSELKTLFVLRDISMENYDRESEFRGIIFEDVEIDATPGVWKQRFSEFSITYSSELRNYIPQFSAIYRKARPMQIILSKWFGIKVYSNSGNLVLDLVQVPILALNTDKTYREMSGLINKQDLGEVFPYLNKERKGNLLPKIIGSAKLPEGSPRETATWATDADKKITWEDEIVSDEALRELMAKINANYYRKHRDGANFEILPKELGQVVFDFIKVNNQVTYFDFLRESLGK